MEFKGPYLRAMREQAPKMFVRLSKTRTLDALAQQKSEEAHQLLDDMLAEGEKDADGRPTMQARREAEELVRAQLINFPEEGPIERNQVGVGVPPRPVAAGPAFRSVLWNSAKVLAVLVALTAAQLVIASITRDPRPYNPAVFSAFREIEARCFAEPIGPRGTKRCDAVSRKSEQCANAEVPCTADEYWEFLSRLEFDLPPLRID